MYFVHPQIQLKNLIKAKLALIKPVDEKQLKDRLENYFPGKQIIFTDMGRSAFKVILDKLNLEGSEIIMPAYICDIFHPILKEYKIKPIFVDIDADTFHVKLDEIEKKITPETKAILVCHTYGLPLDVEPILSFARSHNLKVIEDCAHSFGAKVGDLYAGNFGDVSFFSLYKQFPSLRGGMLVCPKEWEVSLPKTSFNFRDLISFLNCFTALAFVFKKFGSSIAGKVVRKEKLPEAGGINRASLRLFYDFLGDFEKSLQNRKELALFFQEKIKELGFEVQNSGSNVFCYLSVLASENLKDKRHNIVKRLRKYGVFCTRIWHTPIILSEEAQKDYDFNLKDFPNTINAAKRVVNFPLQNYYKKKDMERIVKFTAKVLKEL
jgi:dTDP-4-amino-4,6-dideoxygalactose transaminase